MSLACTRSEGMTGGSVHGDVGGALTRAKVLPPPSSTLPFSYLSALYRFCAVDRFTTLLFWEKVAYPLCGMLWLSYW